VLLLGLQHSTPEPPYALRRPCRFYPCRMRISWLSLAWILWPWRHFYGFP